MPLILVVMPFIYYIIVGILVPNISPLSKIGIAILIAAVAYYSISAANKKPQTN